MNIVCLIQKYYVFLLLNIYKMVTIKEIYKLANEVTANEFTNVLNGFNNKETELFESLVNLGDRKEVALFTVIAEKYNKVDNEKEYSNAYTL